MLFLPLCTPHQLSVYATHIQILILIIILLANILFRVLVKWQDTYTTCLDWHTCFVMLPVKKGNDGRKKQQIYFTPDDKKEWVDVCEWLMCHWQSIISSETYFLIYICLQQFHFYFCLSLVPVVYVLWHFIKETILLVLRQSKTNKNEFTDGVSGVFIYLWIIC